MDIDLSHSELASACPDVGTIKNWEMDLAGGCLAKVIHEIAKDAKLMSKLGMKLQISLITDNGNRKGIDHFVKMIVWVSVDEDGQRHVHHFNLDIDKDGHTTSSSRIHPTISQDFATRWIGG